MLLLNGSWLPGAPFLPERAGTDSVTKGGGWTGIWILEIFQKNITRQHTFAKPVELQEVREGGNLKLQRVGEFEAVLGGPGRVSWRLGAGRMGR